MKGTVASVLEQAHERTNGTGIMIHPVQSSPVQFVYPNGFWGIKISPHGHEMSHRGIYRHVVGD